MKILSFVAVLSICFPVSAAAQIAISEIAWMGVPVEGVDPGQWWRYEWIELYNPTDQPVALTSWRIEFSREEIDLAVQLSGIVPAHGYFVAGASERLEHFDLNYANLAGRMHNGGQRIVLRDAQGQIVEEIDARGGWFAGDNETKQTMERRFFDRPANDPENWGTSTFIGGTPGEENSVAGQEFSQPKTEHPDGAYSVSFGDANRGVRMGEVFHSRPFAIALVLALVSSVLVLVLKKRILPRLVE